MELSSALLAIGKVQVKLGVMSLHLLMKNLLSFGGVEDGGAKGLTS